MASVTSLDVSEQARTSTLLFDETIAIKDKCVVQQCLYNEEKGQNGENLPFRRDLSL